MGALLHRLAMREDQGKIKEKKNKHKRGRQRQENGSTEADIFSIQNGIDHEDGDGFFSNGYEPWDNKLDQQHMIHMNDPPGAPNTYTFNPPVIHSDMMTSSWSFPYDTNQLYYPRDSRQEITAAYNPSQDFNSVYNASPKTVGDERFPKKVQFSNLQQQRTPTVRSLTSTQSWHESNTTTNETNVSTPSKLMRLSTRSSVPRSTEVELHTSPLQTSAPKPIYVVLDHSATKAERDQMTLSKHQRKNRERNHLDETKSSNSQTRVHTLNQSKSQRVTDSPNSNKAVKPTRSLDLLQTTVSTSERLPRKNESMINTVQKNEHTQLITNGIKPMKSKSSHRQEPLINNETITLRGVENYRRHRRHHRQPRTAVPLDGSPSITDSPTRRMETRHARAQMKRIQAPQNNQPHQKQPIGPSTGAVSTSITRSRI